MRRNHMMRIPSHAARAPLRALALAAAALALAGCKDERAMTTGSIGNATYTERHPITVGSGLAYLDLLPGGGPHGVTARQAADIQAFAADWRKNGRGPMVIQVPQQGQPMFAVSAVRAELQAAGVPAHQISEQRYAGSPAALNPVRLAFPKLEARVPHECGYWPKDVAGGANAFESNKNQDYWNFGCAYQQNLAAMVADPEDLIRPRAETPARAGRRDTVLDKYRKGENTVSQGAAENKARVSDVGSQ